MSLIPAAFLLITALGALPADAFKAEPVETAGPGAVSSGTLPAIPPEAAQIVWETDRGVFDPQPAGHPGLIRLVGATIDPAAGDADLGIPPELMGEPPAGAERGYFIVQFTGPIAPEDRSLVESFGGTILGYVPDLALLVSMTADGLDRIEATPRVAWTGLYHPAYKISTQPAMSEPGRREMVLLVFPEEDLGQVAGEAAAAGATIDQTSDNGINKMIRATIDTADLAAIARIRGVSWIEPFTLPQTHNDQCQWVVQTWSQNNRRIWNMGIRGEGQILSVCDTGIRTTHQMFRDPLVAITTFGDFPNHRKIIAYQRAAQTSDILFGDNAASGYHGTHTACTVAGEDSYVGGASNRDGMALQSKLYFLDAAGLGGGIIVPTDLNDLFILPYNGNAAGSARIVSNSWGRDIGGYYDLHSMTADQFMWLHPEFLAFFSNGNTGQTNGVGSPATAKNVVSAGGSMNGTQANQLYSSTSRGPTDDGRYKPTICAPAQLYSAYGANDTGYVQYAGTSMACPAMAGATGLIRQYLTEGWYPTGSAVPGNAIPNPSAALLKAMAVNSADPNVAGANVPNNHIGWGRILVDDVAYFPGDQRKVAVVDFTEGLLTGEYIEYQVYVADNSIPIKATLVWTDYPGSPGTGIQLVNDLNLVANDGTDTYLGNRYSSGQSIPGGDADYLNVEECVRRNTPQIGVWTFRVEAFNAPFGPQPFALVISGGLGSEGGIVLLDKVNYGIEDMTIRVIDLNAGPSIQVTAVSTTEPATETVTLAGSNGVYTGVLPLRPSYPISEDGELSVSNGDEITITYQDANPPATLVAKARVDLVGTIITNVRATETLATQATIEWETSSLVNAKVYYGTTPDLGEESELIDVLATEHAVTLTGLDANQLYYYDVESSDHQNNAVRDDNSGFHYTFSTGRDGDVLLVIGDETFLREDRYDLAFERSGWSKTVWRGGQSATPFVGGLDEGMASYKAVVWQTGWEQYPMFTQAAMDSVAKLMDLGSRLAVWSHDVAWDFCDPTSPNYTVARCQWMRNELKAIWQADPTSWTVNTGYAGDPISGNYTGGVPYTPFRPGAAGDEVDGVTDGGTFNYVWRSNATPDDIALRWISNANIGNPANSLWGGTRNRVVSNFYEITRVDNSFEDSEIRADIIDKTLTWLVGRDNPVATLLGPNGGEVYTDDTIPIAWSEEVDGGQSIVLREIYYSGNGGDSWILITDSPGTSPYDWDISSIPNGDTYKVRIVLQDDGDPTLSSVDSSTDVFTIDRPGGDTRGPKVVAGSMMIDPNPIFKPDPVTLTARLTDIGLGGQNVVAAEWSHGPDPAPPGGGTPMNGSFDSPTVDVDATVGSVDLTIPETILWVRGRDAGGAWGFAGRLTVNVNGSPQSVDDVTIPARHALHVNAPNPFNPVTTIRFDLPAEGRVELAVFDVTGRKVRSLVDGVVAAGRRSVVWDGKDDAGRTAGSGIYFYRLEAGAFTATKRMALLK